MSAPLILGTNSIKDVGYNVDNSLRFDDGSTDYLSQTSGTTDNEDKGTISVWIKRSDLSRNQMFASSYTDASNRTFFKFDSSDRLDCHLEIGGVDSDLITNRVFRDPSAWYNIVISIDTSQSTSSDRVKIYVNGVQETSFSTSTYPAQNANINFFQSSKTIHIGNYASGNTDKFSGYMSEFVFANNQQLDATSFGEFDEDSGIWKPIDVSGLTFGTNGFYLDFEDSSALGNDVSGNNNDFTVNNLTSIDQTTDTCTNNYATLNPLDNYYYNSTFSDGNLKQTCNSANYSYNTSTFGVSQGKWYVEIKNSSSGTIRNEIGIIDRVSTGSTTQIYGGVNGYGWFTNGNVNNNSSIIATYSTWTAGDIMGIALDLDNNKVYFAKNGTWQNSADPSAGTNGISITDPASTLNGVYFIATGDYGGSDNSVNELNFGNPTFTISSGNSDGNGYGNFEYSVPSGYYALNTKNLAEYG